MADRKAPQPNPTLNTYQQRKVLNPLLLETEINKEHPCYYTTGAESVTLIYARQKRKHFVQESVISSISQAAEEITDVNSIYLIAFCALLFVREIISNPKFFK